jgi:predicted membrane chloride channel (bestrophin family)
MLMKRQLGAAIVDRVIWRFAVSLSDREPTVFRRSRTGLPVTGFIVLIGVAAAVIVPLERTNRKHPRWFGRKQVGSWVADDRDLARARLDLLAIDQTDVVLRDEDRVVSRREPALGALAAETRAQDDRAPSVELDIQSAESAHRVVRIVLDARHCPVLCFTTPRLAGGHAEAFTPELADLYDSKLLGAQRLD